MADQRIQSTEKMVGAGHDTLPDTLNRLALIEHNADGTHKYNITGLPHIDVRAYGAVGDGTTDDTQAIQDAIDAANTQGALILELNGKTYRITKTIDLKSNVFIVNGTIYVDDIVGDLTGSYTADNYPIVAGIRVQSLQNCGFFRVKFTGNSATAGSVSNSAIYIDYPYSDGTPVTGTDGLFINYCTFTNISRFGIAAQCLGGQNWDISNNKFFLSGGATTTLPTYGSQEGVQGGVDLIYDEGGGTPTRSFVDSLQFNNNQFIIDCSTQNFHGVAYKIQGAQNSSVSGNITRKVGANSVTDHSSPCSTVFMKDSVFNGNVCGGNVSTISSLHLQGCVNVEAAGNYIYATWCITTYIRGAYSSNTSGLSVMGMKAGQATSALYLGLNYTSTYGVLTDVEVSGWRGEVFNYLHTSASNVRLKENIITRYRNTTAASAGPLIMENNTVYASNLDNAEIYLHSVTAKGNKFIGTTSGGAGYYVVRIYNTKLFGNTYEQPSGSSYTGYIRIYDGTLSEVVEAISNFLRGSSQYTVYNSTATEQKTNIYTAAPTTNAWNRGDVVWNPYPAAGGFMGWVCTTAGTPGTWKTFGAVTA